MPITGTCGHKIENTDNVIAIKEYRNDYDKEKVEECIVYVCVCEKCKNNYKKWGLIVDDEKLSKNNFLSFT